MTTLPDFAMDVPGWYGGNAYPETHEYRITVSGTVTDGFVLKAEDHLGGQVAEFGFDSDVADSLIDIGGRDHTLSGYEDDWSLPDGLDRMLVWDIPTTETDHEIRLHQGQIDNIREWLRFALGFEVYDGNPDMWEF